MLTPEEAESHPNANVITRAVGVAEELKVDTLSGDVAPGDQFLLASDGLTRLVASNEMVAVIYARHSEAAADLLVDTVLSRGAPDNISLVIIKVV